MGGECTPLDRRRMTRPMDQRIASVTPEEMVVPAGLVGLVLGGGIAAAGLVTRLGLRRYAWPRAVGIGLGATVVAFVVTLVTAVAAFGDLGCRRPPIV